MPFSYFYVVEATLRGPTCPASSSTGPSQEAAVAPTAGKQTVNFNWNASRGTGSSDIAYGAVRR